MLNGFVVIFGCFLLSTLGFLLYVRFVCLFAQRYINLYNITLGFTVNTFMLFTYF